MDLPSLMASLGSVLYTGATFVVALSIIVFVHEFGHYIVGRWSGIRAEVFSIGFGPVLWSRMDRRGTRWQIAALPFGGYVKFLGDANASSAGADEATMAHLTEAERRQTLHGAPLWARAATVFAGPAFNFVLSILVFAAMLYVTGVATDRPVVETLRTLPIQNDLKPGDTILAVNGTPTPDYETLGEVADTLPDAAMIDYKVLREGQEMTVSAPTLIPPLIQTVLPASAAKDADLREGDVVLRVDDRPITRFDDLRNAIKTGQGAPVKLSIWRRGEVFETELTPRQRPVTADDGSLETGYQIGIAPSLVFDPATRLPGPGEALAKGVENTWEIVDRTFAAIGSMFAGRISTCNLNGPIGMAKATESAASAGLSSFIWMIAALSTAIGLVNLFPIPVLDGGHLVFHAYEWAFGRPPSDKIMNMAMAVGLTLVLALMFFGLSNDLFCS